MTRTKLLGTAFLAVALALTAHAQFRISIAVHANAQPEATPEATTFFSRATTMDATTGTPVPFAVYPVAGTMGMDLIIPYFVDLNPASGVTTDWNCTHLSYDGNTGEDAYIRSFREEDIGVPVFAALDGTVIATHDGEPDHNTDANAAATSNFVTIRHTDHQVTRYDHLRKGVLVSIGQHVAAGTQIGWVGSSGPSTAPHIHFESQWDGVPYEPMAGPCRPGPSGFVEQPVTKTTPYMLGAFLSSQSPVSQPPFDDTVHTSTFTSGMQRFYMQTQLANVAPGSPFTLRLTRPDGFPLDVSGIFTEKVQEFSTVQWSIDANLDILGNWTLTPVVNGTVLPAMPFTVVANQSQIINRPPYSLTPSIDSVRAGAVAVCRSGAGLFADPDTDVVTYTYDWAVNGRSVRRVQSAARSDVLDRGSITGGDSVSCTVTASDGMASTAAASAFATVGYNARRRATGH